MATRKITARERRQWPRKVIIPLERPFVDARGLIQPLVDVDMAGALLITSRRGRSAPTITTSPTGTIATS